jgi:hypothetical protein
MLILKRRGYVPDATNPTNLLVNAFFEGSYVGGLAPNWTKNGTPTVSENANPTYAAYGGKSQHIVASAANQGVVQSVTVLNGQPYAAKLRVYVVSGTVALDVKWGTTWAAANATGTGWKEVSSTRTTDGTAGQVMVRSVSGAAEFYVDAVMLETGTKAGRWVPGQTRRTRRRLVL